MFHLLSKLFSCCLFMSCASPDVPDRPAAGHLSELRVTTFNLNWYPHRTGNKMLPKAVSRKKDMISFINESLADTDVFIFQEVTNKSALQETLRSYDCHSYHYRTAHHQYVVLCHKKQFQWKELPPLDISEGKKNMRPALSGVLHAGSTPVAKIIGVHLASGSSESKSEYRSGQFRRLLKHIEKQDEDLPVIVAGDFNLTKGRSEADQLRDLPENGRVNLVPVENSTPTYNNLRTQDILDYVWSSGLSAESVRVWPSCMNKSGDSEGFTGPETYLRKISDHCPLTVNFRL